MSSRRTTLFLYVVLVVLPAVVFGSLLWHRLDKDQERRLNELPIECADAADRLAVACARELNDVLEREGSRPFEEYRQVYFKGDLGPILRRESDLDTGLRPDGILGWFSFRATDVAPGETPIVHVLRGSNEDLAVELDQVHLIIEDLAYDEIVAPMFQEGVLAEVELKKAIELEGYGEHRLRLIRGVVLNVADGHPVECQEAVENSEDLRDNKEHDVYVQYFSLKLIPRGQNALPWVMAYRNVVMPGYDSPYLPSCINVISHDVLITQGFLMDPAWLFDAMPRQAAQRVLGPNQALVLSTEALPESPDVAVAPVDIFRKLSGRLDSSSRAPQGVLHVTTDPGALRQDFQIQNAWFVGMALVLTISMAIGILLLLSSIQASRMEALRTRNFVASVTHELRTPIAAVKLYGEMLSDGWVTDEKRKSEYLERIVHESDRLGGLVDRVLLRRRLFDQDHSPAPGDLNQEIRRQQADLEMVAGRDTGDLAFDLAPDLPHVLLLPEGVHVVVQNLVENARKYAPVELGSDGTPIGEPILVRTRLSQKGSVLLEVLDRGAGIPEKDRQRVFEAFLRLGDESTRRTKGTGLGLHLVSLQAGAMKAKVRALPRAGGGTVMQVTMKRARGASS